MDAAGAKSDSLSIAAEAAPTDESRLKPLPQKADEKELVLDDVMDRERGIRLRDASEPDDSGTGQERIVAAHEYFLTVARLHERAVGALIDEREAIAARFDARVEPRDQITLDDDIVVLGAPERDALCGPLRPLLLALGNAG